MFYLIAAAVVVAIIVIALLIRWLSKVIRDAWTLTVHDSLTRQLSEDKARGLDDIQAGAVLFLRMWQLPVTNDTLERAALISRNLGERLVIGMLMFVKRIGLEKAMKNALAADSAYGPQGIPVPVSYFIAQPLMDFTGKHMNRIWNNRRVSSADATDAAFAAFYATLIAPFTVVAWLMLAELKDLGYCPEIDNRDHIKEGIMNARRFLETTNNADPKFCAMLRDGIKHLSKMQVR